MKRIRLTESQLHRLIEQALNELDWKTYDNAISKLGKPYKRLGSSVDINNLSDPIFRWAIIKYFSKKYGRKNIKPFIENLSDEQLYDFLEDCDRNGLGVWADIDELMSGLENARINAFAKKYGHKRSPNKWENNETTDQEGNVWNIADPSIYDDKGENYVGLSGRRGYASWDQGPFQKNDDTNNKLYRASETEAGQDIVNQYNRDYKYEKGKGYKLPYESLSRRVTESVVRKLNERIRHYDGYSRVNSFEEVAQTYGNLDLVILMIEKGFPYYDILESFKTHIIANDEAIQLQNAQIKFSKDPKRRITSRSPLEEIVSVSNMNKMEIIKEFDDYLYRHYDKRDAKNMINTTVKDFMFAAKEYRNNFV